MPIVNSPGTNHLSTWWKDLLFLSVTLGGLFFLLLGIRPLFVPDEGRYAEIAREMVASGDYLTPYLNGIEYFEKPVLFYWLEAAWIKLAGLNLWSLRGVNASLGLLGCLLTYITTRQLYDRLTGLLAAFILGTNLLFFIMTQMISLDLTVTVFLAVCLYAFLLGATSSQRFIRDCYFYLAAGAAGLAVLTKGLIGIVFPMTIIGTWILLTKEWYLLRRVNILICVGLFLLIAAPWHILISVKHPEFAYFYFIEQHILRYSTPDVGHYQPIWFFIPCLIIGFFPWIVFLPQAIINSCPRSLSACFSRKIELFFLLWALLIFTFFSFSKSKLIPYLLPIFPALAILTAHYIKNSLLPPYRLGYRLGYLSLCLMAVGIAYFIYLYLHQTILPNTLLAKKYGYAATFLLISGSLTACLMMYWNHAKAIIMLLLSSFLFLILMLAAIPSIDTRTILPLAEALKPMLTPQDIVITYNQYYQDLPFYLQQPVHILNWRNELSYGMKHQQHHEWMINDPVFWQYWQHTQCVFVIMDKREYEKIQRHHPDKIFYPLKATLNNILITNCQQTLIYTRSV